MKRFKSAGQAQRLLSAHDQVNNLFHLRRDHVTAVQYRAARARAFEAWPASAGLLPQREPCCIAALGLPAWQAQRQQDDGAP
jgi:hypothetical protein